MSWIEEIEKRYCPKGKFSHDTPKTIILFPYTTSKISPSESEELASFYSITGELFKDLSGKINDVDCSSSSVIANVKDSVDTDNFSDLQHIIKSTIFDDNDRIHPFHPAVFYHLSNSKLGKRLSSLAYFSRDIFFGSDVSLAPEINVSDTDVNVFHKLILSKLPPLNDKKSKRGVSYYKADDPLCDCFLEDYKFLRSNPRLFTEKIPELLQIYYFLYQVRLIENLNSFFQPIEDPLLYFSVDWENMSKGRLAYQAGWKRLESKINTMFSHAHCLELLNQVPIEGLSVPYSYKDIVRWGENATPSQLEEYLINLGSLTNFYRNAIEGLEFDWSLYDEETNDYYGGQLLEAKLKGFFKLVQYQFEHSNRKAASNRYSKWFSQFAIENFIKRRGPLGNTLRFTRDQLLFLTRLCIGDNPEGKLRLTKLWHEYERRGIALDFETRNQVVKLFVKLNLLEKKSDSGDAQYVRAIF